MKQGVPKTCPSCGGQSEPGHDSTIGHLIKCAECAEKWNRRVKDCGEALMDLLRWIEAYTSDNGGLRVRGGSEALEEREKAVLAARRALIRMENA